MVKGALLLYLGGMGSKQKNFYVDLSERFGYGEEARNVQSLYLDGKRDEAYAAVPDELVRATSLIGSEEQVAERLQRIEAAGVDRLIVSAAQFDPAERKHTVERLAAIAGVEPAAAEGAHRG